MYPRNAASPEPIAIGTVLLTADGTVQTSGVTVRIKPIGVSEADGVGTVAYSTNGVVLYTPTQAETNYTSFVLIATKASCIPASITVITTASATPGTVLLAPVTHTSAVVPTVTNLTNPSLGTNAPSNWINAAAIAASALDNKGNWNIGKTGYELTQAFPANFASLGINSSGHVSRVVLVDTTTTNTDMRGTDSALLASSYTAAPTASQNATQVRTELATELGRIDATISSRSTFAGGAVDSVVGAVGSVTSPVTVGTNNDKTGYALTQSFPSNFAALGINSSGHVSRVVLVDTTTTNTDMIETASITGVADDGSTTTSIVIKSIAITSITAADQLKGRIVIFDKDTTTAALRGQGAPIEGGSTTALIISAENALTTAPAEDDTFTIY